MKPPPQQDLHLAAPGSCPLSQQAPCSSLPPPRPFLSLQACLHLRSSITETIRSRDFSCFMYHNQPRSCSDPWGQTDTRLTPVSGLTFYPSLQSNHNPDQIDIMLNACTVVTFNAICDTYQVAAVGKEEENDAQDYDADIFLPSKALWLLGSLLFWTVWLLLRLLQMFLWSIKGLLWFVSVSMSPLCRCVSFLLSHVLLLLPYLCDAVYFATACPLYVCGMCIIVVFALFNFTSVKSNIQRFCM
ncbi:Hypothetical protein SMAX5B_002475 [Scophthalmus maximus]|uniref:Uncharacterized protein n=1 Tax=Scophthalmus maximus TaxID=52904 RepID=A0A2U9C696_SCOMX|nr:Hypothetical protein SMAX5B_002475 [Scophthalmus maximus]